MPHLSRLTAVVRVRLGCGDERGLTLVEISIAAVISLVMIAVVFLTASATLGAQEQASEEGATTAPTMLAANAVEQIVNNAFVPNGTTTITSNCYDPTGGTPLTATDGPFVPSSRPTTASLYICAIRPGTTAAYTYEITFPTCGGTSCLAIDRLNCSSGCTTTRINDFPGVSNTASSHAPNPFGTTPFSYYYENGSSWTNVTPPFNDSTVNLITAIKLDFSTPTSYGKAQPTEVQRVVLLPPELGGYG